VCAVTIYGQPELGQEPLDARTLRSSSLFTDDHLTFVNLFRLM
jgi:hypothetical protein